MMSIGTLASHHRPRQTDRQFLTEHLAPEPEQFGGPSASDPGCAPDRLDEVGIDDKAAEVLFVKFGAAQRFGNALQLQKRELAGQ